MRFRLPEPIAIAGAGFSGAAVALQLLRLGFSRPALLFERASRFGRGLAYDTAALCHWLNAPARNMSLHEEEPKHFAHWLKTNGPGGPDAMRTPLGVFANRGTYGRYVAEALRCAVARMSESLQVVHRSIICLYLHGCRTFKRCRWLSGPSQEVHW